MKGKISLAAAAVVALCGAVPTQARAGIEDQFTFSGFGTLGGVVTDTNGVYFRRDQQPDGADKSGTSTVDTNLGVQVTFQANSWLSATIQGLAIQRNEDDREMQVEWAFVKATPLPGLTLRGGRMALPTFLVSESRNVGYANTWLRAPVEVYGIALVPRFQGADLSYTHQIGSVRVTGSVLGGHATVLAENRFFELNRIRGGNVQFQKGPLTFRIGSLAGHSPTSPGVTQKYTFRGIGASYDKGNVVVQSEYVQRRSDLFYNAVSSDAWYVMGGYRFGSVTPYASVARVTPQFSASKPPNLFGYTFAGKQQTVAAGVRWDALSFAALKFQAEHVNGYGANGVSFAAAAPGLTGGSLASIGKVNVFSATIDFVF